MQDRPTERVRVLLDGLTASAIVDRVHPYYSGYQFEGEWLDTLKESIEGELDDLDRIIRGRAGTVGAVDRLREYVANAPASSMGEMARSIVHNYCDTIEREAGDQTGACRFAERLEAAAAEREDVTLFGVEYTALPLDADGVPIHVGDAMDERLPFGGYAAPAPVDTMELSRGAGGYGWMVRLDSESGAFINPKLLRHHHAPTVEDLLREYALKCEEAGNSGPEVKRLAAEYAARLLMAGEDA